MRIIFFSDLHGNKDAFTAFLRQQDELAPDQLVFCGDIFGYYYYTDEILSLLRDKNWVFIKGNHDKMVLQALRGERDLLPLKQKYGSSYQDIKNKVSADNIDFISSWPDSWEAKVDGLRLAAFHGTPDNPSNGRLYPDSEITDDWAYEPYDFVFLGHTHHKMIRHSGDCTIINPGSLGQPRDGRGSSFALFNSQSKRTSFYIVEYNPQALLDETSLRDADTPYLREVLLRRPQD